VASENKRGQEHPHGVAVVKVLVFPRGLVAENRTKGRKLVCCVDGRWVLLCVMVGRWSNVAVAVVESVERWLLEVTRVMLVLLGLWEYSLDDGQSMCDGWWERVMEVEGRMGAVQLVRL
jgi:hypothetical protein